VAKIVPGFQEETTRSRFNGEESIGLVVQKKTGENLIRTAEGIKWVLEEGKRSGRIPAGVAVNITLDESKRIRSLVDDLDNNILTGFLLVAGFVMIVMGLRNATFVAIAIPFSFLITLAYFWMQSISLNFVVLFSLIMALGMVTDNAIVVVENIFRHRQMGFGPDEAAMKATGEVAWPVITSTLTTLAAFAPLLFWPGIMGKFMGFLPHTVIVALVASLFVGLVINPTVCAKWMRVPKGKVWGSGGRKLNVFMRFYKRVLETSLHHKWIVAGGSFGVLAGVSALFVASNPGIEFFPSSEPASAYVDVNLPEGTRLAKTDRLARRLEGVANEGDIAHDAKSLSASVGTRGITSHVLMQETGAPNIARVSIEFKDIEERVRKSSDIIEGLRETINRFAVGEIQVKQQAMGPSTDAPVNLEIAGDDYEVLGKLAENIRRIVQDVPGVVDLRDDYEPGRPELKVVVDRKRAALLGLSPLQVGLTIQTAYRGSKVGVVRYGEDEYDVNVIAPKAERVGFGLLDKLYLTTLAGDLVPASAVASWNLGGGSGVIRRVDRRRVVTVAGDVAKGFRSPEVRMSVEKALKDFKDKELPPGYGIRLTGEQEMMDEAQSFLVIAFVVACFLIALIMIAQFNSMRIMMIIMSEVVLSLTGVFVGLLVTGMPFCVIMTGIGVVSLAGVVVNNGIILMDFTQKLRERGLHPFHALVEAGITRFRPVMLTAIVTVAGLLPMAIGLNIDFHHGKIAFAKEMAQMWSPMAVAVILGLSIATVLTLVVAPNLYAILYSVKPPFPGTADPKNIPEDIA
jgi:multidrug efflux pump